MLWGVVTGALGAALWLVIAVLPSGGPQGELADARWHTFWMLNLGLAIGASWLGNGLWNAASKRLPLTLSGQMIVFETLFALLYAFIYDQRTAASAGTGGDPAAGGRGVLVGAPACGR